jgi:hypothetical protein
MDTITSTTTDSHAHRRQRPRRVRKPTYLSADCSGDLAWKVWVTTGKGSSPNYPCDVAQDISECGDSTIKTQTSDASPPVSDCLHTIKNIEGNPKTKWTTQVLGDNQREITSFGQCKFSVEAVLRVHRWLHAHTIVESFLLVLNPCLEWRVT